MKTKSPNLASRRTPWLVMHHAFVPALLWIVCATIFVPHTYAQDVVSGVSTVHSQSVLRGVANIVEYNGAFGTLRAKPNQPDSSPIHVRVAQPDAKGIQRIEFVGAFAGTFELRDYVELADGSAVPSTLSIPVVVVSSLPPDAATDLNLARRELAKIPDGYLTALYALAALWCAVPVVVFARRYMRKRAVALPAPIAPAKTVGEEVREMLLLSRQRSLSTAERGRLELLTLQYLQNAKGVSMASTMPQQLEQLQQLRSDPECAPLLLAMEEWLHQSTPDDTLAATRKQRAQDALAQLERRIPTAEQSQAVPA